MCIEMGDYDEGKALLERAVESEPMNAEVLDAYGALLAEMGQTEGAIAALKRAAELSPESGHEKFMYLGQLMEGQEALDFVKVGCTLQLLWSYAWRSGRSICPHNSLLDISLHKR